MRLKQTSENLEAQKNSNFFFGWRGPLVMIFDRVGMGTGRLDGVEVGRAGDDR